MFPLAIPVVFALIQGPLTSLRSTSTPGYGQVSALSINGTQLIQARGPEITRLSVPALIAQGLLGSDAFDPTQAILQRIPLEASISNIAPLPSGDILVAGGDFGLFLVKVDGSVIRLERDPKERWCIDIAIEENGSDFVALWSAWDNTEVRSYRLTSTNAIEVKGTSPLRSRDQGGVLRHPASGHAIEMLGGSVYVAMGGSGIARIKYGPNGQLDQPCQGPVFHPASRTSRWEREAFRAQDLGQAGGFLYVAAQAAGLIEVKLDDAKPFNELTTYRRRGAEPTSSQFLAGPARKNFTARTEAVLDASIGRIVVAVAVLPVSSRFVEWGPFSPRGTFAWDLGPPHGRRLKLDVGLASALERSKLLLLERPLEGGDLKLVQKQKENKIARAWSSLTLLLQASEEGPERFWVFDNLLGAHYSARLSNGELGPIIDTSPASPPILSPTYTTSMASLLIPDLILPGMDFSTSQPLLRIEEAHGELSIRLAAELPSAQIPLLVQGSWLETGAPSEEEWFVAGSDSVWSLLRLQAPNKSAPVLDRFTFRFPKLKHDLLGWNEGRGRSYSAAAIDPRTDASVLALSSSKLKAGVRLYSRNELVTAARELGPKSAITNKLPELELSGKRQLDTNPELKDSYEHTLAVRTEYFNWDAGGKEVVLGVAAGSFLDSLSANFQHPKLALFRMGDCPDLNSVCSSSSAPNASNVTLCIGANPKAFALAFTTARIKGKQYAFMADSTGRVSAFDLEPAFSGPKGRAYTTLLETAHWTAPPSILDGLTSPMTDLKARFEKGPGDSVRTLYLYAAANRLGVVRLRVTPSRTKVGSLKIDFAERINTPFHASGLSFMTAPLSLQEVLAVSDHVGGGVKLYTQPKPKQTIR